LDPASQDERSLPPDLFGPAVDRDEVMFEPVVWALPPKFQDRVWLHALLLLVTLATTTWAGADHYASFRLDLLMGARSMSYGVLLLHGLWYSGTILAILGCHELGHYLACRYYNVDASLPFFIPAPLMTGTLGAFIRIREPIPSKRMLFDIGIAGPLAGFVVAVPALFLGLWMSRLDPLIPLDHLPPGVISYSIGEPLLFKLGSSLLWGASPEGYSLNLHPMAFAAWFGLLATALNLFPIGQLDGGHISYALLGRRSVYVTWGMMGVAACLCFFSMSWIMWTVLMAVILFRFGARHPRTPDEHIPLDRARLVLAFVALAIFVACFTPVPIQPMDLIGH
jgi:membrane-associated protease RseP (regulator of RpoE activity)